MEKEAREYLPIHDDIAMKKIFVDHRLWPGVVSYLEFECKTITAAGIRDGLFKEKYGKKKTLTKLGHRRGSGVRLHVHWAVYF